MSGKRPHEPDELDGDSKRFRSSNGSPAPAPATANGESEMERKKREAQERIAAMKARMAAQKQGLAPLATPAPASPAPVAAGNDVDAKKAEAQRKIAEMKARMAAQRGHGGGSVASPVNGGATATPPPREMSDKDKRIAEARARAEERARKNEAERTSNVPTPPPRQDGRGARGGMGVALHPSLRDDGGGSVPSRGKASQGPKFSTTRGNQQAPKKNPYLADEDAQAKPEHFNDAIYDSSLAAKKGGDRKNKKLVFNEKGKFMAQANALRQQARLEDMKRRIAAENRKVEIEEASDKAFLVPAPPEVEWWDEGLLPENQNSYDNCLEAGRNKIEGEDSIITALVQHPVQLAAPQDKFIPALKPLMLTKTEQAKMRRQRRTADMKEEQAKVRLGLVEPPPPKVKKSNMMRVLGEQAVKDPTAVEARVNREIAQRKADHDRANEDRKLTAEQRHEKLERQQAADEAKGLKICVFRVDNLSSGKHRYQIDVNAKQHQLFGIVVLHPEMNLIIVEGGVHGITAYKKLMLNRIKWGENTLPLSNAPPTTFTGGSAGGEGQNKAANWCNPLTEDGELKDLSDNRCVLVWEGDELQKIFRRWQNRACETDGEAKEVLRRFKMENMWTLAKSM